MATGEGQNLGFDMSFLFGKTSRVAKSAKKAGKNEGKAVADYLKKTLKHSGMMEKITKQLVSQGLSQGEAQAVGQKYLKNMANLMAKEGANTPHKKLKEKLDKQMYKSIVQKKWFETTTKAFTTMVKNMGGGLLDLFKLLFVLSFLGSGFVTSIVKMVINLGGMLIKVLIGMIPEFIKTVVTVLPVIFDAIVTMIPVLWKALKDAVGLLFAYLEATFPNSGVVKFLKSAVFGLMDAIEWIATGVVSLGKTIADNWEIISTVLIAFGILYLAIMGPTWAAQIAAGIATALAWLPVIGVIILVVAAITLLIIGFKWLLKKIIENWDAIVEFLWNAVVFIFDVFTWPYRMLWKFVVFMFGKIKKVISGIFKVFSGITDALKGAFSWENIKKTFMSIVSGISDLFGSIVTTVGKYVSGLFTRMKDWFYDLMFYLREKLNIFGSSEETKASGGVSALTRIFESGGINVDYGDLKDLLLSGRLINTQLVQSKFKVNEGQANAIVAALNQAGLGGQNTAAVAAQKLENFAKDMKAALESSAGAKPNNFPFDETKWRPFYDSRK